MVFFIWAFCQIFCSTSEVQNVEVIPETIVIYGDSRTNHQVHREVVDAMVKVEPIAVFHTGDLVEDGWKPELWAIFNDIIAPLLEIADFYPALGNHEYNSTLYFDNFELPDNERWYTVDINNIHFIILDSNFPLDPGTGQYLWLANELEQTAFSQFFLIVVLHHPPYSSGPHGSDEKNLRPTIVPLFEKYSVHIVFNGHDHVYERSLKNQVIYVVTGGGGAPLHKKMMYNPFSKVFKSKHHFCRMQTKKNQLVIDVFDRYLNIIDHFEVYR